MPTKTKAKPEADEADTETDGDEKLEENVVVEFNGYTFTIPKSADDWPTRAELARIRAVAVQSIDAWLDFLELLLGEQQWRIAVDHAAPKRRDLFALVNLITDTVSEECVI